MCTISPHSLSRYYPYLIMVQRHDFLLDRIRGVQLVHATDTIKEKAPPYFFFCTPT